MVACGASVQVPRAPATKIAVSSQIVTPARDTTEPELLARAERELLAGEYLAAKNDFELLLKSDPSREILPKVLFDLGTTYEALAERENARDAYHRVAAEFPALPLARNALVRCVWLHAFLEEWKELGETGETLIARTDIDVLDQLAGLGGRALSRAELGDTNLAMRDVEKGLDIIEDHRIGMAGKLPSAGAQIEFALGEARRIETERIALRPVGNDFVAKVSARCQGLLDAQRAYADAMRTTDAHFAMMAGYRLGAMYEKLHAELMSIPPDGFAKNERQRQIFYGIMHVRYRALLDKALIMLNTTLDVADKLGDKSAWVERGRDAKRQMEAAIAEEKTAIAKFPFTEEELEKALRIMQDRAEKSAHGH
jgi:tetratricopeptide (TPR) repeat protein